MCSENQGLALQLIMGGNVSGPGEGVWELVDIVVLEIMSHTHTSEEELRH
jgi:hypothetical protein